MVWIKVEARQGRWAAQKRFFKRAVQVWLALVVGSVLLALLSALLYKLQLNHTAVWFQYSRWIVENPLGYLATVALMWMQPNLMDVLALYVLLIATVPLTVPFMLRFPWAALVVSLVVWWFAQPLNALIPNQRPGSGLLFNPFGWQLLFFIGVAMGAFRDRIVPELMRHRRLLTAISVALLLFGLAYAIAWRLGAPAKPFAQFLRQFTGPIGKWDLDGLRLISILAASWLVAVPLSGLFGWMAASRPGEALAEIGRGGLFSFVACVILSIWGDAMGMLAPPGGWGFALRLGIDIWVTVALWAAAATWMRRDTWMAAYRTGSRSGKDRG